MHLQNALIVHLQKQLTVHLPRDFLFLLKCVGSLLFVVSSWLEKSYWPQSSLSPSKLKLKGSPNFWSFESKTGVKWPIFLNRDFFWKFFICYSATEICITSSCHFCLLLVHHHLQLLCQKSNETVLEFLACDAQTFRRTEEKSNILRWVSHLKTFDISWY